MATSTVPRGRIEVAARRGWTLLVGWAIDADGNAATTADAALAGSLHPLGGEEATGGYKGYGLAMVVELLTGILGGAAFGPNVVSLFSTHEGPADLGETFVVIDPAAIDDAPGASNRGSRHCWDSWSRHLVTPRHPARCWCMARRRPKPNAAPTSEASPWTGSTSAPGLARGAPGVRVPATLTRAMPETSA